MTQQIPDKLRYQGADIPLTYCPEYPPTYRVDAPPLPKDHPRITKTTHLRILSCCWRGYQGTWEIQADARLYLIALDDNLYQLQGSEPVLADWVSGSITLPNGKTVRIRRGWVSAG